MAQFAGYLFASACRASSSATSLCSTRCSSLDPAEPRRGLSKIIRVICLPPWAARQPSPFDEAREDSRNLMLSSDCSQIGTGSSNSPRSPNQSQV